MISRRRILLFLLGTGACLMLVLENMDLWAYSGAQSPFSRILSVTDGNSTTSLIDGNTYEVSLANNTLKEDPVTKNNVNKSATLKTTTVMDPLNHTFPIPDPDPTNRTSPKSVTLPTVSTSPKPVSDNVGPAYNQSDPDTLNRTSSEKVPATQNRRQGTSSRKPDSLLKFLSPEQILRNMSNSLVGAQVQNPKTTRHVLVVSYFRAGSTFMGDLLQQNWKTFYTFEPLHLMSDGLRINDTQVDDAHRLLRDLMYCNFSSSMTAKYLKWAEDPKHHFLMYHNKYMYLTCYRKTQLCFRHDFVEYLCNRAPWQVIKLNRLSMEQVGRFVQENPELDVRVLHLVRDPRGIVSSRKMMTWCNNTECGDFNVLCKEMDDDYKSFQRLKELNPQKFFQLRYEDLASHPKEISKQLFAALDLPYTVTITRFLNRSTKGRTLAEARNPYSTRRNSYKTAFEWRKKMRLEEIKNVQAGCTSVLANYDYLLVNSSLQLVGSPLKLYSSQKTWLRR